MNIQQWLLQLGIPSYRVSINTTVVNQAKIEIAESMPNQIGWIYGLSVYTDSVTPENVAQITMANSRALYLNLKDAATDFFETIRLDELNYQSNAVGVPANNNERYTPVGIPGSIDLSQSYYFNPTIITSGVIMLNLWYISDRSYSQLVNGKIIKKDGRIAIGQA